MGGFATPQVTTASTTLTDPLHNLIRRGVMDAYQHEFNAGKEVDPFLVEAIVSSVTDRLIDQIASEGYTAREQAYEAIDTERDYQDHGFGNAANADTGRGPGKPMTRGECLLTLEVILNEAKAIWYKPQTQRQVADLVRKLAGVAVQYMERYGTYPREFTPDQQAILDAAASAKQRGAQVTDAILAALHRALSGVGPSGVDARTS